MPTKPKIIKNLSLIKTKNALMLQQTPLKVLSAGQIIKKSVLKSYQNNW
jgi:hypothetical protein